MKKTMIIAAGVFVLSAVFCTSVFYAGQMDQRDIQRSSGAVKAGSEEKTVIVIDAGHGGIDAGASGKDGVAEKDINLDIAWKLKEEAEKYGADVVMTRETDSELLEGYDGSGGRKRYDMENRKRIIEENNPVLTVSIHLNSYPEDASIYGAQVFYPSSEVDGEDTETAASASACFAQSVQKTIDENIQDGEEKEAAKKDDIFLFREVRSPIILVECGFLSNPQECEKLQNPEYQSEMAAAVWAGINKILSLPENGKVTIVDSANKS